MYVGDDAELCVAVLCSTMEYKAILGVFRMVSSMFLVWSCEDGRVYVCEYAYVCEEMSSMCIGLVFCWGC